MAKNPKVKTPPTPDKQPKTAAPVADPNKQTPQWCFASFQGTPWLDGDGRGDTDIFTTVCKSMKSFSTRTWNEIEHDRPDHDHMVRPDKIIREARDELERLQFGGLELWRFRFSGERRIWGVRDGRLLRVLWWDPHHQICPAKKKRT